MRKVPRFPIAEPSPATGCLPFLILGCARAEWPRSACILDPVRATVVCNGPAQIMEVVGWFLESAAAENGKGVHVCKIKNKFSLSKGQLVSRLQEKSDWKFMLAFERMLFLMVLLRDLDGAAAC